MHDRRPVVPMLGRDQLSPQSRAIFDDVVAKRGRAHNVFRALANSPAALRHVAALGEFVRWGSSLDDDVREAIILTVAREHGCAYEWTHHWNVARQAGHDPEHLVVGEAGSGGVRDEVLWARALARALSRREPVDGELVEAAYAALDGQAFIDVLTTIGYYTLLAQVTSTCGVRLEDDVELVPFI